MCTSLGIPEREIYSFVDVAMDDMGTIKRILSGAIWDEFH